MEQQQILAAWRRELAVIATLMQIGQTDDAVRRLSEVRVQVTLAQWFGLPDAA
jgi:hypothetical protein